MRTSELDRNTLRRKYERVTTHAATEISLVSEFIAGLSLWLASRPSSHTAPNAGRDISTRRPQHRSGLNDQSITLHQKIDPLANWHLLQACWQLNHISPVDQHGLCRPVRSARSCEPRRSELVESHLGSLQFSRCLLNRQLQTYARVPKCAHLMRGQAGDLASCSVQIEQGMPVKHLSVNE